VREGDSRPSASTAAGWYVDPGGNGGLRWWDGVWWTDDYADRSSVEGAPFPSPRNDRLGDQPDGRPARRDKLRRSLCIGIGIVVLFAAGAMVGGAIEHQEDGTASTNTSIPKSVTTNMPTSATTIGSIPNLATVQVTAGQTVTLPGKALHDEDVVRIVVTGLLAGIPYSVSECRTGGSYDRGNCYDDMNLLTADSSGTLRIEYTARKGPFGSNNVICSTPLGCEIDIYINQVSEGGLNQVTDGEQDTVVNLDFA
jgi:hypothetical protein